MPDPISIQLNGQARSFPDLPTPTTLNLLIEVLGLKADRIAVEHNGQIAPRTAWSEVQLRDGDRLEIVHFVGGGHG